MMLVHVIMPKAEEVAAPAEAAAAAPAGAGRARSHQEGQEGRRRRTRRRSRRSHEGDRRARAIPARSTAARGTTSASRWSTSWRGAAASTFEAAPVEALVAKVAGAEPVLLAKPLTFMNASGEAVGGLARYFKIEPADLLVVVDEVQLPLGKLRARARGSAGGHNGLKSIIAHLGDAVRAAAHRRRARRRAARPGRSCAGRGSTRDEAAEVERMTTRAADAAEMFITSGIEAVMNGFNGGDPATTE